MSKLASNNKKSSNDLSASALRLFESFGKIAESFISESMAEDAVNSKSNRTLSYGAIGAGAAVSVGIVLFVALARKKSRRLSLASKSLTSAASNTIVTPLPESSPIVA